VSDRQNERLPQFCELQDHSAADLLSIRWSHALEVASGKQSGFGPGERAEIVQVSRGEGMSARCGIGYDLHRLAEGRKLIVGGIELPFDKGPVGHSDGDVLAHALCDALLGAAGLGDIGTHFPDTDPKWKGANSLLFLEHAKKLLDGKGLAIEWIDAVVITEKPKLGPHFPRMREALAGALHVSVDHVHLKAKTNEGVDAIGRGEAIAAYVVVTLSMD
jgi:2-C-methyl-D-erythritol 2,4-cyclodiphosphate synthase